MDSGCKSRSCLPKDFAKLVLDGVTTDVYNKLRCVSFSSLLYEIYSQQSHFLFYCAHNFYYKRAFVVYLVFLGFFCPGTESWQFSFPTSSWGVWFFFLSAFLHRRDRSSCLICIYILWYPTWECRERRSAGKWKDAGSTSCLSSPFPSEIVINGHCLVTFPCTINEKCKWLTSLPILMRKSFWW